VYNSAINWEKTGLRRCGVLIGLKLDPRLRFSLLSSVKILVSVFPFSCSGLRNCPSSTSKKRSVGLLFGCFSSARLFGMQEDH
jgi:hypothetical protein